MYFACGERTGRTLAETPVELFAAGVESVEVAEVLDNPGLCPRICRKHARKSCGSLTPKSVTSQGLRSL